MQITFSLGLNAAENTYKSPWAHMSIFPPPQSGARGLKSLIWLKYYIVLNGQVTFNLWLNAAENTHIIKKNFK